MSTSVTIGPNISVLIIEDYNDFLKKYYDLSINRFYKILFSGKSRELYDSFETLNYDDQIDGENIKCLLPIKETSEEYLILVKNRIQTLT